MNYRNVIEHALRTYYAESAEPNAIARELLDGYDAERDKEKATATAATATPRLPERLAFLLDAITKGGGRWTVQTVVRLYRLECRDLDPVAPAPLRTLARTHLHTLTAAGHLEHHIETGRQYYTLKKGGRRA